MTAIAAIIALSSTPLLAQATDSTAGQAAPVVVAPPAPAVAPAAPETATPAPVESAPAPAMKTVGTPVVHDAGIASTPSPSAAAPTRAAPARRVSAAPSVRAPAPATKVSLPPARVAPAKIATAPVAVPAPVAKATPTAAQAAANTPPAAPAATATRTTNSTINDETLPIAGGIGLAILALGGAAYAVNRRRRRGREDDELVLERRPAEAVAVPEAAPLAATPTMAAPVARAMPRTLPNGFDISRFGRHAQAAYLGPTPDNPSHSLKRRLKRASFFDQREREAAAAGRPVEQAPVTAPAAQAARVKQDDGQITIRMAPQRRRGGLGHLFQR